MADLVKRRIFHDVDGHSPRNVWIYSMIYAYRLCSTEEPYRPLQTVTITHTVVARPLNTAVMYARHAPFNVGRLESLQRC